MLAGPVKAKTPIEPRRAPYPQQLTLDWTDYCNAKCFFCYREKYEQQIGGKGEFIPFSKLKRLEKVLSQVKVFGISSGIGEPLLHPELEQILRWLYDINPSILIRTTTNGTALTSSKAAWFAGHIDWLSVSLNAANGETHMRDMFPHLAKRGIDAQRRWELHLRHLREFIAALPPADRPQSPIPDGGAPPQRQRHPRFRACCAQHWRISRGHHQYRRAYGNGGFVAILD